MTDFVFDTMTDTDGTLLTEHTGESGAIWAAHPSAPGQLTITSGRAWSSSPGIVYASGTPPGPDYTIEADYYVHSSAGNLSIFGRMSTSGINGYMFRHGGAAWQLYRAFSGGFILLDSLTESVVEGRLYRIRVELHGTTQRAYVDDVLACEAGDTTVSAAGHVGLRDTNVTSATTGKHLDAIRAYAPSVGTRTIHPVLKIGAPHIGPLRVGERN